MTFKIKAWAVRVFGYGEGTYYEASRGKAMAAAWRCDAFGHLSFGAFMRIARCRKADTPDAFGTPITVNGNRAFYIGRDNASVQFAFPDCDSVLHCHPSEVLPEGYRPPAYRSAMGMPFVQEEL